MARTRSIKPEFWSDEKLSAISRDARLTFIGLWCVSDDYGVTKGHPVWLKNQLFPYDDVKTDVFKKWLKELVGIDALRPFEHHGEKFYHIKNFKSHQKVNHPSQAKNPSPPDNILSKSRDNLEDSRNPLAETETETETETESNSGFDVFWNVYPRHKAKAKAETAFKRLNPNKETLILILEAIEKQKQGEEWQKDTGKFIPYPATWLNGRRWEDELELPADTIPDDYFTKVTA